MPIVQRQSNWTIDSFLEWEATKDLRFEFNGFEPVAMVGAKLGHNLIILNGVMALRRRLRRCSVFAETAKLRMAHSVRYPDLMVVCSAIDPNASEVTDPVVVMEVLSDGTSAQDRIVKNQEYRDTPSIQHYAILEQDRVAATVFARAGSDWTGQLLVGRDAVLVFREIDVEIPLAEFYEGMEIEASTP